MDELTFAQNRSDGRESLAFSAIFVQALNVLKKTKSKI